MAAALAALASLAADEYLVLAHRREPFPLYGTLAAMGYCHRVRPGTRTAYEIVVWRCGDPDPEAGA